MSGATVALWVLAILLWVAAAIWLYSPYPARPYDVVDFFDYLPILRTSTSAVDAISDLIRYYAQQGRFNPAAFASIGIKWSLFGEDMLGWQVFRFMEMVLLSWLTFALLRRLGLSALGAIGGSLIFLASPPASAGWMRMNTAEPSGAILLVILMILMLRWTDRDVPRWGLAAIAMSAIGVGFLKEFLLVSVVVPAIVLALLTAPSDSRFPRSLFRSRRLLFVGIGGLLVAVPVLIVAFNAPVDAYSRKFATGSLSPGSVLLPAIATLFPFAPADPDGGAPLLLAVSCYVLLLVSGWGLVLQRKNRSRGSLLLFALGIGLPVSGAIAYAGWPTYALMYALPFQVGTAILVGTAITAVERYSPRSRPFVIASGVLILTMMASAAQRYSRFVSRSLTMTRDLAVYVGTLDPSHPVRFEACPGLRTELWSNYGRIVSRYAASLDLPHPPVLDSPCGIDDSVDIGRTGTRRIVLSDAPVRDISLSARRKYSYVSLDWRTLRLGRTPSSFQWRTPPASDVARLRVP
jgi:hypothetical protein